MTQTPDIPPKPARFGARNMPRRRVLLLWIVVPIQAISTLFFLWQGFAPMLGLRTQPIGWALFELIQIGAALGLLIGFAFGLTALVRAYRHNREMAGRLAAASTVFADVLEQHFTEWRLTPAERDVAWFTLKGLSNAEIARLRETSEGTVKAQSNAIYRKAEVTGRTQLLSLFIEDLLDRPPVASGNAPTQD